MRLTLRTLLAYLDDILEPADAREIGAKIAESSVATETVERIREVMRRRRITAPELTGPGSGPDPNLVAEYLDNTLAPDSVADIERICLESDIHLSEAASCHQILTLVLGEAVDISPALRERMYVLGAVAPASEENGHGHTRLAGEAAAAKPAPLPQQVPDYLKRRPLWQRLAPGVAVVVLLGWLALVLSDQSFWGTAERTRSDDDSVAVTDPRPDVIVPGVVVGDPDEAAASPTDAADVTDPDAATAVATTDPDAINPAPPPDVPELDPEAGDPAEMAANAAATVEPAPPATPDEPARVEPQPAAVEQPVPAHAIPVANLPRVMYTSVQGVLLQYQEENNDWGVLPRRALLHPGDWVASPEPFFSELTVGSGELKVMLNGGAVAQSLAPTKEVPLGIGVDRGRVGFYRPGGADAPAEPQMFGIRVGSHTAQLTLLEPETLCGIEVILRQPRGEPEEWSPPGIDGGLFVVSGSAALTLETGEQIVLSRDNGWLPWPEEGAPWEPGPLLSTPQWLTPEGPQLPSVLTTYANLFERVFPSDQPVSLSVPAVVKDRRAQMSKYAVLTLSLTQNIPQLLRALSAEHDEARQSAIVGLREWLPRAPENSTILHDEIDRAFRDNEVEIVYELLWGYNAEAFQDGTVSRRLVGWLGHDEVAIRELAIYQIKLGTNRPTDYHPMAPLAQRQAAIMRLQDHVDRTGALLPP